MSEQSDEEPKTFKGSARPLDRNNLPEEFTVEFLSDVPMGDLEWLEEEAELTEKQRISLAAAEKELLAPMHEAFAPVAQSLMKDLSSKFSFPKVFPQTRDPLGDDIQKAVEALRRPRPTIEIPEHPAKRRHEEQQASFQQMTNLLAQLVERTEQQHRAAERQKTTNWALAVIAVASMAGTFATVNSMTHFWWALIATAGVAGILYPFMHK